VANSRYLTQVTRATVSTWLDQDLQDIQTLALLVGDPGHSPQKRIQLETETVKTVAKAFSSLNVVNRAGVVACLPSTGESGIVPGANFRYRSYLPMLSGATRPFASDMMQGSPPGSQPTLTLFAPLRVSGRYAGYCAGDLDLAELRRILGAAVGGRMARLTLLDRNRRVVASTDGLRAPMERIVWPAGSEYRQITADVFHWIPPTSVEKRNMPRWRKSSFVQTAPLGEIAGWTIVVEQSLTPLLEELTADSTTILLMAAIAIVLSVGISHLLSRGVVHALVELQAATEALPIGRPEALPRRWPKSGISELDALIGNFGDMSLALTESFAELHALNESLEERVELRTLELAKSEQRYRMLADNARDLIFRYRLHPEHVCTYTSPSSSNLLGYSPEEYYADADLPFKIVHPEDRPILERIREGREVPSAYTLRWLHRDGQLVWMDTRMTLVHNPDGSLEIIGISRDISEEKKREELTARLEAEQLRRQLLEKERRHLLENDMLMKDLHDGIGGIVTNIAMLGQYAQLLKDADQSQEVLLKIVDLASAGVTEIRSFMNSTESRDSVWGDLLAEVKEFAGRMLDPHGIELQLLAELPAPSPPLGAFRYVNLSRICRELITNIVKHASARKVRMEFLLGEDRFHLLIADDGVGYDPERVKRRGTGNIKLRAEQIGATLSTVALHGTTVRLSLPLAGQAGGND